MGNCTVWLSIGTRSYTNLQLNMGMLNATHCPVPMADETEAPVDCIQLIQLEKLPLTAQEIEEATRSDHVLSQVLLLTKQGWGITRGEKDL